MQRNRILASDALKKARALAEECKQQIIITMDQNCVMLCVVTKSSLLFSTAKFSEARLLLNDTSKHVAGSVSAPEEYCQGLLADMRSSVDAMSTQERYRSHGAHYMMSK